jgi:hypothetical protein
MALFYYLRVNGEKEIAATATSAPAATDYQPTTTMMQPTSTTSVTTTTNPPTRTAKPPLITTPISESAIADIWRVLSSGTAKFFDTGDLGHLDKAMGVVETRYRKNGLQVTVGGSGTTMTVAVKANNYNECRIVDLVNPGITLIPGC